jgi:Signal transduction histidine kinase
MTASSSTIKTLATDFSLTASAVGSGCQTGDDLVKSPFDSGHRRDNPADDVEHTTYDHSFDALRTGFTAAVSHELRTPLARILALLETAELPDADVPSLLDQARAEVENAGALIDEILFLSELESGREVVSLGHTTALPMLEQVVEALAAAGARAGVELRAEGDFDGRRSPPAPDAAHARAEPRRERGALRRARRHVHPFDRARRQLRVLTAADDGVGVPETTVPRLFERFYRGDAARTTRGTGLGLAIVKHMVAAAGGEVEADGGYGRGLRIRCIFPA